MDEDRRRERDRAKRATETKEREARLCKREETDRAQSAHDHKNMERDHEREVRLNNTSPFIKHLLRLTPQ